MSRRVVAMAAGAAVTATEVALGLVALWLVWKVNEAIEDAWDDDFMLVSCNGRPPKGKGAP